jgi:hypothetical protein
MAKGVTELTSGFEYTRTERGLVATQIFQFDNADTVDHGIEIPVPGEAFIVPAQLVTEPGPTISPCGWPISAGNKIEGLICRSSTFKLLAGHPNKFEITVTFSNEISDTTIFDIVSPYTPTSPENLPITIEFSGEFNNINPDTATLDWKWESDNTQIKQPIPYRVNMSTLRMVRYVPDGNYTTFQANVKKLGGKVNATANPFGASLGGGIGTWLFIGASTEIVKSQSDEKWWRAELEFNYRDPDSTDSQGWQKILRIDGKWDLAKRKTATPSGLYYLYAEGNLAALFDETKTP